MRQSRRRAEGIVHFLIARSSSAPASCSDFSHFRALIIDLSPFLVAELVIYISKLRSVGEEEMKHITPET